MLPTGRREANKQATRAALLGAAQRLFAAQGFEATTVRDIAQAAQVTERTFYRYFDGKEGLIAGEYESWLAILRAAILARPAGEPPFVAVRRAMLGLGQQAAEGTTPMPLWLFSDGPPMQGLRRSTHRPLLRIESAIADAVLARFRSGAAGAPGDADPGDYYVARVTGRVCVAVFRSATIQHRELRTAGPVAHGSLPLLLEQAFAVVTQSGSSDDHEHGRY